MLLRDQNELFKQLSKHQDRLLSIPGVINVGVGEKLTNDEETGEIAFLVYVEKKVPVNALDKKHVIPSEINGFPVDVVDEKGEILRMENPQHFHQNVFGGLAVSSAKHNDFGTMGCLVRDRSTGNIMGLTNAHVVRSRDGSPPDTIHVTQPKSNSPAHRMGKVINSSVSYDCAVFSIENNRSVHSNMSVNGGVLIRGVSAPVAGTPVWKVGASSKLTHGKILRVTADGGVTIRANRTPRPYNLAMRGDSGSVFCIGSPNNARVVALLFMAERGGSGFIDTCYAWSFGVVARQLNIDVVRR
jgi:hypothetical protein